MCYVPIPMTERNRNLREVYLKMPVAQEEDPYKDKKYKRFCTGDRWITLGYLRGWLKYSDAPTTRLRNSHAEAEELYQAEPVIPEGELLVGHLYLPEYSPEEREEYEKLCDMFQMSSHTLKGRAPRKDHLSLDFDKLLRLGIIGIKTEIEQAMERLEMDDPAVYPEYEVIKKQEFYQCCLIELDAVLDLARRYAQKARDLAEAATTSRRRELLRIAEIMEKVPAYPAGSFYEAIQSVQFFLSNLFGLYPLNRPDRYLYRYYREDLEKELLTPEFAQELIDQFCLHVSTRVFSRAACGFIVGGQDEKGELVENDLTYMFITALDHLRLPDPNGALAVNAQTSDRLLAYCGEVLAKGVTHPAFFNDDAIISSLIANYGCERQAAVNYIHTTCAEISVVGKSKAHSTPFWVDMPKILFEVASSYPGCGSFEELMELYLGEMKAYVKKQAQQYLVRMLEASRIGNEAMRVCVLIDSCVEKGKSIYEGGEKYTFLQPVFVGFSTVVDSLVALETLVYRKKQYSLAEFTEIVARDFEDKEDLRQFIIHKLPHYGNQSEHADNMATMVAEKICSLFRGEKLPGGKLMMPGTFSYVSHASLGADMGATFDGRQKGYSYSDGCSPVQGRDTHGVTAMIQSLTSWEQSMLLGGMVVNLKFNRKWFEGNSTAVFTSVLRTFIERGGIELQVNTVDRQTLENARRNPEQYGDLQVRIGGYSDYFTRLSPTLQQEIIDRTEYS